MCGKTRKEGEKYRARLEAKLFSENYASGMPDNPPFYEFMQEYVNHLGATGITFSSLTRYKQILQKFIVFVWNKKGHVNLIYSPAFNFDEDTSNFCHIDKGLSLVGILYSDWETPGGQIMFDLIDSFT